MCRSSWSTFCFRDGKGGPGPLRRKAGRKAWKEPEMEAYPRPQNGNVFCIMEIIGYRAIFHTDPL